MSIPRNVTTGRKSSISGTAAKIMSADNKPISGVVFYANPDNAGTLYIGGTDAITADNADATDGFPLAAGDSIFIPMTHPNVMYVITSSGSTDKLWWIMI